MNGNCHFVYGAAVSTAVVLNLDLVATHLPNITDTPETATLMILGGLIGGILPDIDNPKSYIGQLTAPVSTAIGKVGAAMGKKGSHHRGILHDPITYITGLVLCYLYFTPLVGLFVGCLTHLYLDLFNPMGIPILFGLKHIHLGKLKSGEKPSIIFTWVNVVFVLAVGIGLCYARPYLIELITQ